MKVDDLKRHPQARRAIRAILKFGAAQHPDIVYELTNTSRFYASIRRWDHLDDISISKLKHFKASCEAMVLGSNLSTLQQNILLDSILGGQSWFWSCGLEKPESLDAFIAWAIRFANAIKQIAVTPAEAVDANDLVASDPEIGDISLGRSPGGGGTLRPAPKR